MRWRAPRVPFSVTGGDIHARLDVTSVRVNGGSDLIRPAVPPPGSADAPVVRVVSLGAAPGDAEAVIDVMWTATLDAETTAAGVVLARHWYPTIGDVDRPNAAYDVALTVPADWHAAASAELRGVPERAGDTLTFRFAASRVPELTWIGGPHFIEHVNVIDGGGSQPVALRVLLQPEHVQYATRIAGAAGVAVEIAARWLGPYDHAQLTIVDLPWRRAAAGLAFPMLVTTTERWIEAGVGMGPERLVLEGIARERWDESIGQPVVDPLVDALVAHTSAQLTEASFRRHTSSTAGAGFVTERFFGGFLPYVIRSIRLDRDTDLMRRAGDAEVTRLALALATLERYVGRPTFEAIVREFARQAGPGRAGRDEFFRVADEVSGRDLGWFAGALAGGAPFDYGVQQMTTEPSPNGRVRSTVVVRRYGDAVFAGTSKPRLGPFESGRAIAIDVAFADGTHAREHWDGRDRWTSFAYDSTAPVASVSVDPEQMLLLDARRANNTWTRNPQATRASLKWSARWMLWLQDALLSWSFFV